MSDPIREEFKQTIKQRMIQLQQALKRYDESDAAYNILKAGGEDVTEGMATNEKGRQRTKAMIAEAEKQLSSLK